MNKLEKNTQIEINKKNRKCFLERLLTNFVIVFFNESNQKTNDRLY